MNLVDQYQKVAALAVMRRSPASQPGQTSRRQFAGYWMLRPLVLGLFAAFLAHQLQGQQGNVRPIPWGVYSVGAVYSVETVEANLQQHPDRWLGRTVWVRGVWGSLCVSPGVVSGCVMGMPGQSMYWLAGTSGMILPLDAIVSNPNASYPSLGTGLMARFRVRLAWLEPGLCPWVGPNPDSEGTHSTVPCKGAILQL